MRQRVITSLLLAAVALPAVFARPAWVAEAFVLLLAILSAPEVARIAPTVSTLVGGVLIFGILAGADLSAAPIGVACATAAGAIGLILALRKADLYRLVGPFLAVYVGSALGALLLLARHHPGEPGVIDPAPLLLLLLLPIWAADILAYFVGRRFGKRLLAPTISPKKTVEGFLGGLVGALAAGTLLAAPLGQSIWKGAAVGLAAGILGPGGDLLESALKRRAGVKDSGTLLPGHGGVLDRIDSLLLAAPAAALILLR